MSKRELKSYLNELTKAQLREQVLDLYTRFKPVKTYYNFVFNPKEEKLLDEAKFKISKEYFPLNTRKPKTRRSVAQKIIKHYLQLGVDSYIIADIMLFNIEVAQKYTQKKPFTQTAFYNSMLKSLLDAINFIKERSISSDFLPRIANIIAESENQHWPNHYEFRDSLKA